MTDRDPMDDWREDSRARWAQHARDHELLESELRAHDRDTNDKILAALQTLMRHEEQLKSGAKAFAGQREESASMKAQIEALQPERKTWRQIAVATFGAVAVVAGAVWAAANYLSERATLSDVDHAMKEHITAERPVMERVAAQLGDVQMEQAAQKQQIRDVKDDVKEIKSDLKEALRRGR